jgi:transcription initiation factor IIE alpha subunit
MGRGKAIPEAVHWIIIRLGTAMSDDDIAMYTDVSVRSVRRILVYFRRTGQVNLPQKTAAPQLHKALCDYDIQACCSNSLH